MLICVAVDCYATVISILQYIYFFKPPNYVIYKRKRYPEKHTQKNIYLIVCYPIMFSHNLHTEKNKYRLFSFLLFYNNQLQHNFVV